MVYFKKFFFSPISSYEFSSGSQIDNLIFFSYFHKGHVQNWEWQPRLLCNCLLLNAIATQKESDIQRILISFIPQAVVVKKETTYLKVILMYECTNSFF